MRFADLVSEAVESVAKRPLRTIATAAGTVLGVASLVAMVGMAHTAGLQVSKRFDVLKATEVIGQTFSDSDPSALESRLQGVDLVEAAGVFRSGRLVGVSSLPDPWPAMVNDVNLVEGSAGLFEARDIEFISGRPFDYGHVLRSDRVAVLGWYLADRLGALSGTAVPRSVWLDGVAYEVIGVIGLSPRMPSLATSVIVPIRYSPNAELAGASDSYFANSGLQFVVRTELGNAPRVEPALAFVVNPGDPSSVSVVKPPRPRDYVEGVQSDVQKLVTAAALVILVVGALGIANSTSVSVVERTRELGLRLALGARRRDIVNQIVLEAALVGMWGGVIGASLGTVALVVGAGINGWAPSAPGWLLPSGPVVGLLVGVLAGLIPAYRTGSIQPDRALRTE